MRGQDARIAHAPRESFRHGTGVSGVFACWSWCAPLSRRQKSFLLVTIFVPALPARLVMDLYSTSSRSSRTMRMYSPPCFQTWPWQSFIAIKIRNQADAGDRIDGQKIVADCYCLWVGISDIESVC